MSIVRVAHLSDPHFGTVVDGMEEILISTLKDLKPDVVVMSGDITQRARDSQFKAAAMFKEKLRPLPLFAVPGNHDIPLFNLLQRFVAPYRGFYRYFQARTEIDFCVGEVEIIGLNSTSRWRHVQGSLNLQRIRKRVLARSRRSGIRVALVHHPLDCAKGIDDKNRLRGREQTAALFKEGGIDLILSGHVHDPFIAIESQMVLSVAGTCLSSRVRKDAPNSFNWIEISTDPKNIKITRMDVDANKRFHPRADFMREFKYIDHQWRLVS